MTQVNTTYEPYSQDPGYIQTNQALIEALDLDGVSRVVDLACGTGLLSQILLARKPDITIYAVDISAESIDIARRNFAAQGLLASSVSELEQALATGRGAVHFTVGSADAVPAADGTFDLAVMGNAIHLMPDKDRFLDEVRRLLKPGGRFAFNSVFFTGTFPPGSDKIYTEWMKESVLALREMDEARRAAGKPPIPRTRGKHGRAFDKGWLSADEWADLLRRHGFTVQRNDLRPSAISKRGLELVGAYGGLSEVLMTGYPAEFASAALHEGVGRAFSKLGVTEVGRNWLEVTAVRD